MNVRRNPEQAKSQPRVFATTRLSLIAATADRKQRHGRHALVEPCAHYR